MTSSAEQQQEELEVLRSIFDGDTAFSTLNENTIQYRFGEDGDVRSFLLEIRWPPSYPDEATPDFVLDDLFYNKRLTAQTKQAILRCLSEEAESNRGSPTTYSLIELLKDRFEQLTENQIAAQQSAAETRDTDDHDDHESDNDDDDDDGGKKKRAVTKTALTKAQKRKMWDRGEANEDKPRGYNWVDVVKHLSQNAPN